MHCYVLHLDYDSRNRPIVAGADQKHGVVKESGRWWTIYKPAVNRVHPLLCHLWEEKRGLFGVFADSDEWKIIDPDNKRIRLSKYYNDNDDWLTVCYSGTIHDEVSTKNGKTIRDISVANRTVRLTGKPVEAPTKNKPLIIGDIEIAEIRPGVGSSIGLGDRILEANYG